MLGLISAEELQYPSPNTATCIRFALAYSFGSDNDIQPVMLANLRSMSIIVTYYSKWRTWTASATVFGLAITCAGVEVLLILTLRVSLLPYRQDIRKIIITYRGHISME